MVVSQDLRVQVPPRAQNMNDLQVVSGSISSSLKELFSFKYDNFSDVIPWTDGIGFSRVKKSTDGYASLYKIGVIDRESREDVPLKKLWVSVSYGKETQGGISLGSEKHKLSDPIDVDFTDEFSFNVNTQKLYYRNKEILPLDMLKLIEKAHLKPTKKLRGAILRYRLWFWRTFLLFLITSLDKFFICILTIISGEKIKGNIFSRRMQMVDGFTENNVKPRSPEDIEFENYKPMDFFGWKARRWSVVFYCSLHLGLFLLYFFIKIQNLLISTIMKNSFLILCYVVISFAITEAGIPKLLKYLIRKITPKTYSNIAFKRLKI